MFKSSHFILIIASLVWACAEESIPKRQAASTSISKGDQNSNGSTKNPPGNQNSEDQIPTNVPGDDSEDSNKPNPENNDPNEVVVPAGCNNNDGFTFVKLLTPSISTALITSKLSLELSWYDCEKKLKPLNGKGLTIDIDGKTKVIKTGVSMTYQLVDPNGAQLSDGVIGTGTGGDLVTNENRNDEFYYIQSMNAGSAPGTIVFTFDYGASGLQWESASGGNGKEHIVPLLIRIQNSILTTREVKITSP